MSTTDMAATSATGGAGEAQESARTENNTRIFFRMSDDIGLTRSLLMQPNSNLRTLRETLKRSYNEALQGVPAKLLEVHSASFTTKFCDSEMRLTECGGSGTSEEDPFVVIIPHSSGVADDGDEVEASGAEKKRLPLVIVGFSTPKIDAKNTEPTLGDNVEILERVERAKIMSDLDEELDVDEEAAAMVKNLLQALLDTSSSEVGEMADGMKMDYGCTSERKRTADSASIESGAISQKKSSRTALTLETSGESFHSCSSATSPVTKVGTDCNEDQETNDKSLVSFLRKDSVGSVKFFKDVFFRADDNEQKQMHLGGTRLVLQPMIAANTRKFENEATVSLIACADSEIPNECIFTNFEKNLRMKSKLKPDAWLGVNFSGVHTVPIFVFEHKVEASTDQAHRKSILQAQLAWRKFFIMTQCLRDETHREYAMKKLEEIPLWFSSLDGKFFHFGALTGRYNLSASPVNRIMTHASFKVAETRVSVHEEGDFAVALMYSLCLGNDLCGIDFMDLLRELSTVTLRDKQNCERMDTALPLSYLKSSSREQSGSRGGSGQQQPSNSTAIAGLAKKDIIDDFLQDRIRNLKHFFPVPLEVQSNRHMPFTGDGIFYGKWSNSGVDVFVKSFFGGKELANYEREVDALQQCRGVDSIQQVLYCACKPDESFAVIVSELKSFATVLAIRSVKDVRTMARQILEALVWLHSRGIVHHDIKPDNIVWSSRAKAATLIDFGLAVNSGVDSCVVRHDVSTSTETTELIDEDVVDRCGGVGRNKVCRERMLSPNRPIEFQGDVGTRGYRLRNSATWLEKTPSPSISIEFLGEVGTRGYQAPELLLGDDARKYNEKVDIFSLGVTIKEVARSGLEEDGDLKHLIEWMTKEDAEKRCGAREALIALAGQEDRVGGQERVEAGEGRLRGINGSNRFLLS